LKEQETKEKEIVETPQRVSALFGIREKILAIPASRVIIALILITIVFSILTNKFLTISNFISVLTRISELGIITIGVTFLMISGEFDLSVGAVYTVAGFLYAQLANLGIFSPIALVLSLIVAAMIGLLNGIITLKGRIPSFITTLGMMMILRGSLLGITGGASIYYEGDQIVPTILSKAIAYNIRPSHFWLVAFILIFSLILTKTVYGNWVQATGGNRQAARLMGVKTNKVKMINFTICSAVAGFVGCIVLTRFQIIAPAFGTGIELDAIAASVIGGTLLMGGYGTVLGGALGATVVTLVRNGLVLSGAPPYWYRTFIGVILIITAIINLRKKATGSGEF
jgi:simple sugar transport system permease protein